MQKQRIIAGHKITLTVGKRYLAARPVATGRRRIFPVFIDEIVPGRPYKPAHKISRLSYSAANRFLSAFNNGRVSISGRVWR